MKISKVFGLLIAFVMLFSSVSIIAIAEGEPEYYDPYDFVSHFPNRYEPYVELLENYQEGSTYQWYKDDVIIEDETASALECELEFASNYACVITFADATKTRVGFNTLPAIEHQPKIDDPVFEVTDSDKVESYQWYSHIITDTAVTDENASSKCATCENEKYSSYDKDANLWTGTLIGGDGEGVYELFCFEVELKKGEQLLIDVGPEVQEIRITDSDYDFVGSPSYSLIGDIGVFTVDVDETYIISIYTPSKDSKFSAYIRTIEKDVLLEDETENELQNGELGGYYYCVATYDNDTTLKSNVVAFIPEIYQHPDAKNREFDVAYSDYASFQWYQVVAVSSDTEEIVALDGENESVLKNYELGATYYCEASYPYCMVLKSNRITIDDTTESAFGDIDNDGDVDIVDYIFVKRAVLKNYTLTEEQETRADIDADGDIDMADYILVKRMVLGTYKVK